VYRLRDLDRRQACLAAVFVVLLFVPFGVSMARAANLGFVPSGDDALIGLRAHDVFSDRRPLIGQPSTSHLYGPETGTSHPGPIEFYWLAAPMRVFGPSVGAIAAMAIVTLSSVLVTAWVVLRRAGPAVAAWSALLLSGVLWASGTAILTDPISSSAGGIPLLALAALAWAVAGGDFRLLPLGALFASWVLQQHLAIVVPAAAVVVFGVAGATVAGVGYWRLQRVDPPDRNDPAGTERWWPWVAGALATVFVCWSTVLWQQATGRPGNLTAIVTYAQESESASLGALAGLRQAVRAVGFPPLLMRSDLQGDDFFWGPMSAVEVFIAVLSYVALAAIVVAAWRRRRSLSLLAAVALALAAAGAVNGSKIPDSIEAFRTNFYRWSFVMAWLAWLALGWAGALAARSLLARRGRELPVALPRFAPIVAALVMVVPAIASMANASFDDERRDQYGFAAMRAMSDAAIAEAGDAERVTLVLRGRSSVLASGSAVALQLERTGISVVLPEQEARFWHRSRILEPGDDPGQAIFVLSTARGEVPDTPGKIVAHVDINEDLRDVMTPLVQAAQSSDVVPSDRAEELLARDVLPDERSWAASRLASIADDPEPVLSAPVLLRLMIDGYFASPSFDRDALLELERLLPAETVNDDDVFELRVLTEAELAELVPSWAESQGSVP